MPSKRSCATIQYLYVSDYADAVKSFRQFTFLSQDTGLVYESEKNIGEVLFSKLEDYKGAVEQYTRLIGKYPDSKEKGFFQFRMAKSHYNLLKFEDAIKGFGKVVAESTDPALKEESLYQIGNSLYTKGDYEQAIDAFEDLLVGFPKGKYAILLSLAWRFAMELEQLDEAFRIYESIKDKYPERGVLELKLKRVSERRSHRNR